MRAALSKTRYYTLLIVLALSASLVADANEEDVDNAVDTRKLPEKFFALPMELDLDSGATNGDAAIMRIMPLYTFPTFSDWKLIHLDQITIADAPGGRPGSPGNPDPVPGDKVFGLGDWLHATFYTPHTTGHFVWGVGAMISMPTATDSALGSGKWSAGPAIRLTYRTGHWNLGLFGGQLNSFAGDDDRGDVSQLILRGAIRRQLPNDWFFVSAPIITANWKSDDEKWLVPLGGGFGKGFRVGEHPWALSLQGYYNVVKPEGAPDWVVRLALVSAIPLGN